MITPLTARRPGQDTTYLSRQSICSCPYSFATVVLVLKVLLHQQDLDKPFTGGLGSYKLYVLVAYHIQQHLALGGSDRPGEVLIAFFFRYGNVKGHDVDDQNRTMLSQHVALQEESGCIADLSNVFQLEHCVSLFKNCWARLWKLANAFSAKKCGANDSLLASFVHGVRLREEREECLRKSAEAAAKLDKQSKAGVLNGIPAKRDADSTLLLSTNEKRKSRGLTPSQSVVTSPIPAMPTEMSAEQLMAAYGVNAEDPDLSTEQRSAKRVRRNPY
jgi:hypothetical protein